MTSESPNLTVNQEKKWSLHYIVGVFWMTYWMANLYLGFSFILPFLTYYVMTGILLVWVALTRPQSLIQIATKPLIWIWTLTAIIPALMYLDSSYGSFAYGAFTNRVVYLSAIGGMSLILLDKDGEKVLKTAATISLLITIGLNLIDIVFTLPFSRAPGRAAGLWMDPNISAAVLCATLPIAINPLRSTKQGLLLVGLTYLAILVTFSRSGILFGTFLTLVYLFAPNQTGGLSASSRISVAAITGILLTVGSILIISIFGVDLQSLWRIESLLALDASDSSSQGRLTRLLWSLERVTEFFWTGRGLGASAYYGTASHNTFVTVVYDYGVGGLLLYLTLVSWGLFQMLRYGWRRALVPGLLSLNILYYGMFAHTVHTASGMAIPMVIFMLKMLIDPAEPRRGLTKEASGFEANPAGLLQTERAL